LDQAGMAKLVDARDLKSLGSQELCRFDPGCPHQNNFKVDETDTLYRAADPVLK
jgi:hypothetical protein